MRNGARTCGIWLGAVFCGIGPAAGEPARFELVDSLRCGAAVGETLSRWGATGEVLRAPAGPAGGEAFRLATRKLGVWITLQVAPGGREATLFRTTPGDGERIELDGDCRRSRSVIGVALEGAGENGYLDSDLASDLARSERLAVFLWSPHMPLSVEALPEISAAARELELALVVLTDPASEPDYVEEVAHLRGIPTEATRPAASVELLFRDIALHAPSVIAFHRGRASAPLPGFRDRKGYLDFLRAVFAKARQIRRGGSFLLGASRCGEGETTMKKAMSGAASWGGSAADGIKGTEGGNLESCRSSNTAARAVRRSSRRW